MIVPDDLEIAVIYTGEKPVQSIYTLAIKNVDGSGKPKSMLEGRIACIQASTREYIWLIDDDDEVLGIPGGYEGWDVTYLCNNRTANWARVVRRELLLDIPVHRLNWLEDVYIASYLEGKLSGSKGTVHTIPQDVRQGCPFYRYTGKHHDVAPWERYNYDRAIKRGI